MTPHPPSTAMTKANRTRLHAPARACRSSAALLLPCMLAFGAAFASAQEPLWGGALVEKIDSLAAAAIADGTAVSLSIGVKRGDDLLLVKGYGLADVELGVPATAETVYRIGSITKQFTAAAIMRLVERGRVDLDDPITDYLPDYPTQGHEVTIRHLLTHTSGIKSYTGMGERFWPRSRMDLSDEEMLDIFQDEPFDFAPGDGNLYNNSAYYLLGVIVGRVTGTPYSDYVQREFFDPLGMGGSSYCHEESIVPNRAEGYRTAEGELLNDAPISMNTPGAAGALCSTVPDLLAWTAALRGGRAVSPESYSAMTTSARLNDGAETGYGFGLGLGSLEGNPSVAHGGGINGFNTMMAHYPEHDLDVVVLANNEGGVSSRLANVIARWALGVEITEPAKEMK